jgi:WXG100 family type VII secretion target
MNQMRVDAEEAYKTSHAVSNDAQELREELAALQRQWDNLSRGWTGAASSAYSSIWTEWLDGASKLVDALAESSHNLGVAAVRYAEQDADSVTAVNSTTLDLGL